MGVGDSKDWKDIDEGKLGKEYGFTPKQTKFLLDTFKDEGKGKYLVCFFFSLSFLLLLEVLKKRERE